MKRNPLLAPLLILCILTSFLTTGCKELERINDITIGEVNLSLLPDGSYEWQEDYTLVTARVLVTIKSGRIVDIQLREHKHGPKHGAEVIIPRILAAQSLAVDVVTGATGSSKVILKAVENALTLGRP